MAQLTFITLCKVAGDFKACSWPALTILQLWKLADIEDDDIQALLHPIRSLETLFVAKCPRLTPKMFRHIKIQRSSLLELSFSSQNEEFEASGAIDAEEDYFADFRELKKAKLDGWESIGPLLKSLPSSLKSLWLARTAVSPSWVIVSLQHLHGGRPASKGDAATVPFKLMLKDMVDWKDVDFAAVKVRLSCSLAPSRFGFAAIGSNLGHGRCCHPSVSSSAAILSLCHLSFDPLQHFLFPVLSARLHMTAAFTMPFPTLCGRPFSSILHRGENFSIEPSTEPLSLPTTRQHARSHETVRYALHVARRRPSPPLDCQ
jgi:hypothetical protein